MVRGNVSSSMLLWKMGVESLVLAVIQAQRERVVQVRWIESSVCLGPVLRAYHQHRPDHLQPLPVDDPAHRRNPHHQCFHPLALGSEKQDAKVCNPCLTGEQRSELVMLSA